MEAGWIDVHAHYSLPGMAEGGLAAFEASHSGCWLPIDAFRWTPEKALEHMDANGIALQMLSSVPKALRMLRESNAYGRQLAIEHPGRFGFLAGLPTDNPDAAIQEIEANRAHKHTDGFAVTCDYNGTLLSDAALDPVWSLLDQQGAVVFVHPNAYAPPTMGRASPLIDVMFETTRVVVDMLYKGVFARYPNIRFIIAHCGAAVPLLSGRLALLGTETWVANPCSLTPEAISHQLSRLYVDTAAMGSVHSLRPALAMTDVSHVLYGSDCGVPCSTERTLRENLHAVRSFPDLANPDIERIGRLNALDLFPRLAAKVNESEHDHLPVETQSSCGH